MRYCCSSIDCQNNRTNPYNMRVRCDLIPRTVCIFFFFLSIFYRAHRVIQRLRARLCIILNTLRDVCSAGVRVYNIIISASVQFIRAVDRLSRLCARRTREITSHENKTAVSPDLMPSCVVRDRDHGAAARVEAYFRVYNLRMPVETHSELFVIITPTVKIIHFF